MDNRRYIVADDTGEEIGVIGEREAYQTAGKRIADRLMDDTGVESIRVEIHQLRNGRRRLADVLRIEAGTRLG